ncbi:MAG TPA: sodium/solute symporter [Armatimonadota bacterium]|nr:sodium/solute symporter [Armatimonadota bacterium]HOM71720.1 sodium/solute symporter [Armatimonadota bacterium]HPP73686.1 sodium/solute symporter [Armatimonadota bacterium]
MQKYLCNLNLWIVVVYVLVMVGIGYVCMRRTKTVSDFFLAGRTLGPWMSAFAYGTTYFSAVIFVGFAGRLGWNFGINALWIALGNVVFGSFLAWKIFARRTRRMTANLNALTMPEFLAARFDSQFLKIAAALIIFIFLVPYSASVYQGLSLLFEYNLGIPYGAAIGFMALLTGVYLIMGGYLALAVTDFLRGIVELFGVALMVLFLVHIQGGFGSVVDKLSASSMAPAMQPNPQALFPGWLVLLSLVVLTSFGPWGLPQMVQKFYSIKSEADVKRAMIVVSLFSLVLSFGAYFTGAMTHLYFHGPAEAAGGRLPVPANLDDLMPQFLTNPDIVFPWVSMVIMLLVFSASMSSLSSLVLVSSSSIAVDLYAGLKKNADKRVVMALMRILCGVFIGISICIALYRVEFIVNLMSLSWGVLAGAFLAPYCFGLFWRRTTKAGAIAGMLSGLATILLAMFVIKLLTGKPIGGNPYIPVAGALAMIVPVIVVPIVSLFTQPPKKEILQKAFGPAQDGEQPSEC